MSTRLQVAGPPPRPVFLAALALMAGLAAGFLAPAPPAWPALGAVLAAGWAGWRLWRSRVIRGPLPGSGLALLAALIFLGWAEASWVSRADRAALAAIRPWAAEPMVGLEGTLAEEPRVAPDRVDLVLRDVSVWAMRNGGGSARLDLKVALGAVGAAAVALNENPRALPLPGRRLRVWGRLRPIEPPTSPGAFDPERAALGKGIGARLSILKARDLELGPPATGLSPMLYAALRAVRRVAVGAMAARLPAEQMPMARALLLGEAHLVPVPERDAYTLTGLAHLLAVSGMNVAFALVLVLAVMRVLGLPPRACWWGGLVGVFLYSALTGFEPPVARAAFMGGFVLGGFLLRRTTTTLASIAAAVFMTLVLDPRNLVRVDWQLSYACVLSLVLLTPACYDLIQMPFRRKAAAGTGEDAPRWWRHWLHKWLLLPLAALAAVQLGIMPLQIYYFRQYNLLSPLYNLLSCELSLFAMLGAALTALLGWVPGLGLLVSLPAQGALALLAWLVVHMAAVPHVTLLLAPLSAPLAALYYATLLGGSWLRRGEGSAGSLNRAQVFNCILTLGLVGGILVWAQVVGTPAADGRTLDLFLLDVGQGDAIVARSPDGRILVVDGGPAMGGSDRGRLTVGPFLKTLGATAIDCLAASHADADHIGGIPYLLQNFDVKMMLEGPDTNKSDLYREMEGLERTRHVPLAAARQGGALGGFNPVKVRLLGPVPGGRDNNASIVLLLDYRDVQILLTGDLETAGEEQIIRAGLAQGQDIEILKLGHHGSRSSTSEDLLNAFKPEAALISVGKNNRYGHPSPEVLARLKAHGIVDYRTDQLGALWVRTDGKRIRIYRFAGA